jgi:hypothetical protein
MIKHSASLFFVLLMSARADTLALRDGTSVTGSWVSIDAVQISFLVDNQLRTYPRSDVSAVTFGVEAPAPIPAPLSQQEATRTTEPELIGAVYFQDGSGKLILLERVGATKRQSQIPLGAIVPGMGNHKTHPYWQLEGSRSPIRLNSSSKMLFLVRVANGVDPTAYSLYPLEVKGDTRRTQPDAKHNRAMVTLHFDVTKAGESTYGLTPAAELSVGEYCFSPRNSNDAYCFGVDPAGQR